jgi:hypothetical protein
LKTGRATGPRSLPCETRSNSINSQRLTLCRSAACPFLNQAGWHPLAEIEIESTMMSTLALRLLDRRTAWHVRSPSSLKLRAKNPLASDWCRLVVPKRETPSTDRERHVVCCMRVQNAAPQRSSCDRQQTHAKDHPTGTHYGRDHAVGRHNVLRTRSRSWRAEWTT